MRIINYLSIALIVFSSSKCTSQDCDANFGESFYKCLDSIEDLTDFKDKLIYLELTKIGDSWTISHSKGDLTKNMTSEIDNVLKCIDKKDFQQRKYKLYYTHFDMDNREFEKKITALKRKHSVNSEICVFVTSYSKPIR